MTVEQAFKGLIDLDIIRITKECFYDLITYEVSLTRFKATHKLAEQFNELKGHPAVFLEPNLDVETIILRDTIDGKRVLQNYDDDKDTEQWRTNLKKINTCFSRHILDMYLKDIEFENYKKNS